MTIPLYDLRFYKHKLLNYKAGDVYSQENAGSQGAGSGASIFSDAQPRRMNNFLVRIGLVGFTGAGKSAFINSVAKTLDMVEPAIVQNTGGEGTVLLEEYVFPSTRCAFSLLDTRGFGFDIHQEYTDNEIYAIVNGQLKVSDEIGRDKTSKAILKRIVADHNAESASLEDKVHALVLIVKGSDPRLKSGNYRHGLAFPFVELRRNGLTITTVVTFDDTLGDSDRLQITKAAKNITGDSNSDVFFIENYVSNTTEETEAEYSVQRQREVMRVVYKALLTAENNIQNELRKEKRMMRR